MTLTAARRLSARTLLRVAAVLALALAAPGSRAAEALPLAPGEAVRITVLGQPDLSGEHTLDEAGVLALPLAGRLAAAGLSPEALEHALAERLAALALSTRPVVTVAVTRRRDVVVAGEAARPGAYQWRPQLTVRDATALAGGRRRLAADGVGPAVQALRAIEHHAALAARIDALSAREARLAHQLAAAEALGRGEDPVTGADTSDLAARNIEFDVARYRSLQLQRGSNEERLALLRRRLDAIDVEAGLIRERLGEAERLLAAGLGRRGEVLELQRAAAAMVGSELEVAAEIAEAELAIERVSLEIATFGVNRHREIGAEIEAVRLELVDARARVGPAREAAALSAPDLPTLSTDSPGAWTIVRHGADGAVQLQAAQDDPLLPGDTLLVPPLPVPEPATPGAG